MQFCQDTVNFIFYTFWFDFKLFIPLKFTATVSDEKKTVEQEWRDRQDEQKKEKERKEEAMSGMRSTEIPKPNPVIIKEKTTKKQIMAGLNPYLPDKPK